MSRISIATMSVLGIFVLALATIPASSSDDSFDKPQPRAGEATEVAQRDEETHDRDEARENPEEPIVELRSHLQELRKRAEHADNDEARQEILRNIARIEDRIAADQRGRQQRDRVRARDRDDDGPRGERERVIHELRRHLEELHAQAEELAQTENIDFDARERIAREIEATKDRLAAMSRDREHGARRREDARRNGRRGRRGGGVIGLGAGGRGRGGRPERREHRDVEEARHRIERIADAAKNLARVGLQEIAHELNQKAEEMERNLNRELAQREARRRERGRHEPEDLRQAVAHLREEVEKLRGEVRELRELLQERRNADQ